MPTENEPPIGTMSMCQVCQTEIRYIGAGLWEHSPRNYRLWLLKAPQPHTPNPEWLPGQPVY